MEKYTFYDTDPTGHEEYDISGEQYHALLQACFKYSDSFSIILSPSCKADLSKWENYRIPVEAYVKAVYSHYGDANTGDADKIGDYEIRQYKLCPELCRSIAQHTDSLFSWICGWEFDNPDDPAFFREDGSVFFTSTIHEGECVLYLKANETLARNSLDDKWIKESP